MEVREDSPWYPSMRLFRQTVRGDWASVVARVAAALREWSERATRGEALPAASRDGPTPLPLPKCRPGPPAGHRPGFSAVTATRHGIVQYFPDEPDVGDSLGWYGEYLEGQVDLLTRLFRPGQTLLEAEPGVGAHALPPAAALGTSGHALLAESRPLMRRVLRDNLGANGVRNVTVLQSGVGRGDKAGSPSLDQLQLGRLDWLKANSGTADVLAGGDATLWRLRPRLFLSAVDPDEIASLAARVRAYGYRCWAITTPCFDRANFNRRAEDLLAGRDAVALLAIPEEGDTAGPIDGGVELS
jgi:hypothetical protein